MPYLAGALIVVAALTAGAYLGVNGHPWLAFMCLLIAASIEMRSRKDSE